MHAWLYCMHAAFTRAHRLTSIKFTLASPTTRTQTHAQVSDCSPDGAIYAAAVFRAFDYALRHGAQLVSCSFGRAYSTGFKPAGPPGPWEDHRQQSDAYAKALAPLRDAGLLVLAAAGGLVACGIASSFKKPAVLDKHKQTRTGNDGVDLDALSALGYSNNPCLAGLTNPGVICVGAVTENDALAPYSNFGRRAVGLLAPGSVVSTWPGVCFMCVV